jgi:uncharacterized protein (DUF924 family)
MRSADDIHRFWFEEHGKDDWFAGKAEFDTRIAAAFSVTHAAVARGEAWGWRLSARGRLAEIIVLDQFSRQLFRGQPKAFAQDPMALTLAQELVAQGLDRTLSDQERVFAYLPYMHSESLLVHAEAMRLYEDLGDAEALDFEIGHREAILRFGRFPRRNEVLGRRSTAEETAYLEEIGDRVF